MNLPSKTRTEAGAWLTRDDLRWSVNLGTSATVTYAFRSSYDFNASTTKNLSFSRFTESQINQANASMQSWSDVANITFVRVGSGTTGENAYSNDATILFGDFTDYSSNASFAYCVRGFATDVSSESGDIWLNLASTNAKSNNYVNYLSYGAMTLT